MVARGTYLGNAVLWRANRFDVRSDIRVDPSNGSVEAGVPLRLRINVYDAENSCASVQGATVDIWHADASGVYSDVSANGTVGRKFLRGYQVTGADGAVEFTTIYPGWYRGRAIHIHFKVRKFDGSTKTYEFTSQIFFDEATNNAVMAQSPYSSRGLPDARNASDNIYTSGAATLGTTRWRRTPARGRILALTLNLDESLAADIRLLRGARLLTRRQYTSVRAGTKTLLLAIPRRVTGGGARLRVVLTDASGNTKVVQRSVRVPARV